MRELLEKFVGYMMYFKLDDAQAVKAFEILDSLRKRS